MIRENGVVLEENGPEVLVRAEEGGQCAGCCAKGHCHGGSGGQKTVTALNDAGARVGDRVVIAVPSGAFLLAAFQVYMIPVLGILAGAAAGQVAGELLRAPGYAGGAAGAGGLAGAVVAILLVRKWRSMKSGATALQPRVEKVIR